MRIRVLEIPPLPGTLDACLEALTSVNTAILAAVMRGEAEAPRFYDAGLWWLKEPIGVEDWYTYPEVLKRRDRGLGSDCEDLAAARCADLRVFEGEPATAIAYKVRRGQYHAVVRRADGSIEDPSRILGRKPKR